MKSEDVGLKLSTLDALHSLITDAPQSVVEHVPALVPRLLNLARDQASMVQSDSATLHHNVLSISPTEGAHCFSVLHWQFDQPAHPHCESDMTSVLKLQKQLNLHYKTIYAVYYNLLSLVSIRPS